MTGKLTDQQIWLLDRLSERPTSTTGGLNPSSFGGSQEAARARRLAAHGYVHLNRIAPYHIRYSITDGGRQALSQALGEGQ